MLDAEFLRHKTVLSLHVIVEGNFRKRSKIWSVGGRGRLAIAEERSDDDKVVFGVESLVLADQPLVV